MAKVSRGTPDQFLAALDNKIAQLQGGVAAASTSAEGVDTVTRDVIEAGSDVDLERYIDTLIGDCDTALEDEVNSTDWSQDSTNIYLSVAYMGHVIDLTIPLDDLSLSFDKIDTDVAYICNSVYQSLDELGQNDVKSATGCKSDDPITAAHRNDYIEDEDEEYDRWKILKQKSVPDSDGFMTEYTLYEYLDVPDDVDGNIYICMFGDSDLYPPDINYADYSTSNKKDALDWFNNFGEEEY